MIKQDKQQPVAAQEAVAHLPRRSIDWLHGLHSANDATRKADAYNRPVPDEQTIPVFAAPVTAAPVDLDALAVNRYRPVPDGLLAYKVVAGDGTRSLFSGTMNECNVVARKLTEAFLDGAHVASTPAAPRIDLEQFREAVTYWRDTALRDMQYQNGLLHEQANEGQRLLDLIDAGQSNCWPEGSYAERVERLMGMSRGEREAIGARPVDSPNGGSEARDAALNTLAIMFHNSEEIEGPDGMAVSIDLALWHEALEAYEVLIGDYDEVTLATSAQAQAGDAEVQP